MKKKPEYYRVIWELDKVRQARIVHSLDEAKKEQDKWLEMGCKVTISPAYRSPIMTLKIKTT